MNAGMYYTFLLPFQIRLQYGGIYRELIKVSVEYIIFGEFMVSYYALRLTMLYIYG